MTYDEALAALYQAPLRSFVEERKRLAAELKASGDAAAGARLTKLARPTLSAWAVNQLWWHARSQFEQLFRSAEQLRSGDLSATTSHRDAISELRVCAGALLAEAGHAANEPTLRRVATTLSALAAHGGFEPDPPGALSADRDPPGFQALGIAPAPEAAERPRAEPAAPPAAGRSDREASELAAEQARAREAAAAERRRLEQQQAERQRLTAALRGARRELDAQRREIELKREQILKHERALEQLCADLEQARAALQLAERNAGALQAELEALD